MASESVAYNFIPLGNTTDKWPMISNIWEFFSEKGPKTIFLSVGSGPSALAELEVIEQLGCPLFMYDANKETFDQWSQIQEILKTRKEGEGITSFVKEAMKKWVLPRNIHLKNAYLSRFNGSVEGVESLSLFKEIETACKKVGLPEEALRIDLMKIDQKDKECDILHAVLHEGFRPSLLMIRWSSSPDTNLQVTVAAGHLQMIGYKLISKIENKYLYYFTDRNYYETCSWEVTGVDNPLIASIVSSMRAPKVAAPAGTLEAKVWPEGETKMVQ